jgi:hypothetical protein
MAQRYFDNWLKAFTQYASIGESPLKMYFWTGVATIAGALRRRVWIDQRSFQWVPNCYVVFVAPPGVVTKSVTMSTGMNLLRELKGIHLGPDAITWQRLVEYMAGTKEMVHWEEKGTYLTMSCATIAVGELGNFLNPQDKDMVNTLIALWDGQKGAFRKETKTSGSDSIINPWINILACTTPSWIASNFDDSLVGGGLVSRCIWIYADQKRHLVAYQHLHSKEEYEEMGKKLIHDLELISTIIGEYTLTPAAIEYGTQWYESIWKDTSGYTDQQLQGQLARKQTQAHKLAMIVAAARSSKLIIEKEHLEEAVLMVEAVEKDSLYVFSRVGNGTITKVTNSLIDLIIARGPTPKEEAYRLLMHMAPLPDFDTAVNGAIAAGFLKLSQKGNAVFLTLGKAPQRQKPQ